MSLLAFHPILVELDDIDDGIYLHIDENNQLVDISFNNSPDLSNYLLCDFQEDFRVAKDEENQTKIDFFNDLINQANELAKVKKESFIEILKEHYDSLIISKNDAELNKQLKDHCANLLASFEDM